MPTDRNGLSVLSVDECLQLLSTHVPRVGRVAFVSDGKPVVLPVNFVFSEGSVIFRTNSGAKLAAAANSERVAFEVDEIDSTWEEGWSVLIQGRAQRRSSTRLSATASRSCRCVPGDLATSTPSFGSCPARSRGGGLPSGDPRTGARRR